MKGPMNFVLVFSKGLLIYVLICNQGPAIRVQILFRFRKSNYVINEIHACCLDALIST